MSLHRSSTAALVALLALAVLLGTSADDGGQPIVARVSKDASTALYNIAIKVGGVPLLLDLAGPMLWLANCPTPHRIIPCVSHDCDDISTTYRPFQLQAAPPVELAERLRENPLPLVKHPYNGGYYFGITGIAVNQQSVATPPGVFDLDAGSGTGGAVFSTVTPYTALRWDIYWPLRNAFDVATSGIARADKVAPFDLCYQASALTVTRVGYAVPSIELMLDGGRNWTLPGASSLVQVNNNTVCFAFVQMASSMPAAVDSPAVILGGHQMENNLLMFDLVKETFAFSGLLLGIRTTCSNFNFTMGSSY
ncbi:unnamed protein product [Triticum turgidum subsp. durum]|uniref:Xylanase inhibitor C-terminal domain-containing protein n=1 Tax=Triticum turgidum subsp. durum TaxID=4567 RepID=A0A9R1QWG2_TRITD|nr:unnamed protein product [Triticum turgidum subsp. durum]